MSNYSKIKIVLTIERHVTWITYYAQIDGATGESETFGSALDRSVRCAVCLNNMGIKKGDVMILMAPNHIDLAIPFYAALYLGVIIAPIDINFGVSK